MVHPKIEKYLENLVQDRTGLLEEMEHYAKENNVPIMDIVGMEALLQFLRLKQPKTILEIGAAIGYSAIRMALTLPQVTIVTIERDEKRYSDAVSFIKKADLEERIQVIFGDALDVLEDVKEKYSFDAIFIDAAKGQYQKFFTTSQQCLNENGMIISDNVLFRGLVASIEDAEKRHKNMVKKIDAYNEEIMNDPQFDTMILPIGDGIAISLKK
nr:O-methyltransferase [Lottiidibacillus patelloidae]